MAEVKDRATRGQVEKQSSRRMGKIASHARAEADAAVVETLAASQQDLGLVAADAPNPIDPSRLSAGERIAVRGFKQPLVFRRHDGRVAEVEAGALRMKVPLADIVGIETEFDERKRIDGAVTRARNITVHARPSGEPASEEINVIGCTVEEATRRVDKFLDEAALAGKPHVRIIHGYGTGALRRGLGEFLSEHALVETTHPETEDRGGNAVTVAELKS